MMGLDQAAFWPQQGGLTKSRRVIVETIQQARENSNANGRSSCVGCDIGFCLT